MTSPEKNPTTLNAEQAELRDRYLKDFIESRNEYLDDLPPERLLPGHPNYYIYKCRMNFFVGVAARIDRLIHKEVITDPAVIEKAQEFFKYVRYEHPNPGLSKKEDVDKVNAILDLMIEVLSQ